MSPLEAVAATLGVINLVLLIRRSIWNYVFGLAMVALYAPIFFEQRLYSDALLQVFFFVVQLYGWWEWHHSKDGGGRVIVKQLDWWGRAIWAGLCIAGWLVWSTAMHHFTDAVSPYWDGAVAVMSVTAQAMLARRLIENWPLWVAVDVLAIGLYWTRELNVTAWLYAAFLLMSLWGWREWVVARRMRTEPA